MLSRREFQTKANVDMTSLMDLVFMLLIVFVVSVPVLDYTTDVTPPAMTTPTKAPENDPTSVHITLDKDGNYAINDVKVAAFELEDLLKTQQAQGKTGLVLRADAKRPYEEVVAVMRAAQHLKMNVSLMTQQE